LNAVVGLPSDFDSATIDRHETLVNRDFEALDTKARVFGMLVSLFTA
jgi:hypothetical protein